MKHRPTGNTVKNPMSGIPYQVPLSDEGHIIGHDMIRDEDPTFLCGRSVYMPQPWYDMVAKAKWGEPYLVVDTRAGSKCSACATKWKEEKVRREYDQKLQRESHPESPITQAEWESKRGEAWRAAEKQFQLMAEWVADLFGGEVVEDAI